MASVHKAVKKLSELLEVIDFKKDLFSHLLYTE